MLKEFKQFVMRGNVVDLAVAVVVGGAFGKIVTSLVNDIIMPLLGIVLGRVNFSDLKYVISPGTDEVAEAALRYGAFMQSIVDFLIIALSIFLAIKLFSAFKREQETAKAAPAAPSKQELLLEEIRDLLQNMQR
jgi:large conductance mechanosensitive channel